MSGYGMNHQFNWNASEKRILPLLQNICETFMGPGVKEINNSVINILIKSTTYWLYPC